MNNVYFSYLFFFLAILVAGCHNQNSGSNNEKRDENINHFEPESTNIYYLLPSPQEFLEIIQDEGLRFNGELLNSGNAPSRYNTQTAIKLNIGVYIADIAYCGLFDQPDDLRNYLEALNTLSKNIYFSESLKLELTNLAKKENLSLDSINQISMELFYALIEDLESTDQQEVIALVCAGAYIESLYLSLNSVDGYPAEKNLNKRLGEQQFTFKSMLSYMREYESDNDIAWTIRKLEPIELLYNSMEYTDEKIETVVSSDKQLTVKGGKVYRLDEDTFNSLLSEVTVIRRDFTQMR